MRHSTRRLTSGASVFVMLAASAVGVAQTAAPARETPRPQDIDPAVNTSSPAQTPARETPRPQDIDPAVSTSAPATGKSGTSAEAKPGATAGGKAATTAEGKPKGKGKALDRLELDTTQITGNRELPKVLYIVPWKRSDLGDLVGKPVNSLLDEVLTPVDRDVFRRENRYYRALTPAEGESAGAGAAPVSGAAPNAGTAGGSSAPAARDER